LATFSGDRDDILEGARQIRDNLLAQPEPLAEVLADEWVFIATQSLGGFGRKAKKVFDRFRKAGGHVHEVADEEMTKGLDAVRDRLQPKTARRDEEGRQVPPARRDGRVPMPG